MTTHQSKLEQLISRLCPNGVEFKELGELLDYEQPTKYIVNSIEYSNDFSVPVLTAGQSFILGYTDETSGIYKASNDIPAIIFDDFTTSFHWVDFNFKVKSSAMKMLRPKHNLDLNFRFVYYAMKCINYLPTNHARHWISQYSKLEIPLPAIEIQNEIVKILNKFTELKAELKAELEARQKQYLYYYDKLLSFDKHTNEMALSDVADFKNGKGHEKIIDEKGKYIVVNSKFVSTGGKVKKYSVEQISPIFKYDILMVMSDLPNGKALAKCFYVDADNKYTLNQRICALSSKKEFVKPRFLFYALNRNKQLLRFDNGTDQTNLRKDDILKIRISIPEFAEQDRIVGALDKFNTLVNDISIGLPAELNARRQQYEYYRNKLLTFKEYVG